MNEKNKAIDILPSVLSLPFDEIRLAIQPIVCNLQRIHIDVMDGHFVPNLGLSPFFVSALLNIFPIALDIHLMCFNPHFFIKLFADTLKHFLHKNPVHRIIFHIETTDHPLDTIRLIESMGYQSGVAIKPKTKNELLMKIPNHVPILFMTVEPGFGGQSFLWDVVPKIKNFTQRNSHIIITDGGINTKTIVAVADAGVQEFVVGSFLFQNSNVLATYNKLKQSVYSLI